MFRHSNCNNRLISIVSLFSGTLFTASAFIIFVTCLTKIVFNIPYDYDIISPNSFPSILSNARQFLGMKGQFKQAFCLIQLTCYFKEYRADTPHFYKQFFTIGIIHPWRGLRFRWSKLFEFNTEVVHARKVCIGQHKWKRYRFI